MLSHRLDDLIAESARICFLKADCQGGGANTDRGEYVYRDFIGTMEKKMDTNIITGIYRGYIRIQKGDGNDYLEFKCPHDS